MGTSYACAIESDAAAADDHSDESKEPEKSEPESEREKGSQAVTLVLGGEREGSATGRGKGGVAAGSPSRTALAAVLVSLASAFTRSFITRSTGSHSLSHPHPISLSAL